MDDNLFQRSVKTFTNSLYHPTPLEQEDFKPPLLISSQCSYMNFADDIYQCRDSTGHSGEGKHRGEGEERGRTIPPSFPCSRSCYC